jgi:NADPH:quinone reductase-like Zn-dependent oxidoreductase
MTTATRTSDTGTGHQRDLLGQTVVVIGGSSGIGLETARWQLLSNRGASR